MFSLLPWHALVKLNISLPLTRGHNALQVYLPSWGNSISGSPVNHGQKEPLLISKYLDCSSVFNTQSMAIWLENFTLITQVKSKFLFKIYENVLTLVVVFSIPFLVYNCLLLHCPFLIPNQLDSLIPCTLGGINITKPEWNNWLIPHFYPSLKNLLLQKQSPKNKKKTLTFTKHNIINIQCDLYYQQTHHSEPFLENHFVTITTS